MHNNKRLFPRVKIYCRVGFELVKWDERDLGHCRNSFEAFIVDISAKGARLKKMPDINNSLLKKLSSGKSKVRLNFLLCEGADPISTFARLIWPEQLEETSINDPQCGFEFIDIPASAFKRIREFVDTASEERIDK